MSRINKPSLEVICFGERDVIATSVFEAYHYPQNNNAETPEISNDQMTSLFSMHGFGFNRDLSVTMQSMMQVHNRGDK